MSTFVLIHGSWHDGSAWSQVIKRLEHYGHKAFGPTVAGHGKGVCKNVSHAQSTQSIVDFVVSCGLTDIVLVGHSYGGTIISKAVEAIPDRVRRLVFWSERYDVPIALGVALRRRAMTERGQEALDTLRQAIAALETTEAKLELAHAHAGLGRGLRRAGQRVEARHHLTISLDLAHRCGASGLEAEIRQELTAAGARPRRPALSGVESLTPTELRVAQLAARGGSNRDIAEMIFVSRNTVAWHLRNVYRKLQIASREQLTRLVEA